MDSFSISQLQQFSGVKAHTIRIWEQRYNALKPHRSEGNTRYYSSDQLKRLLNIVSLIGKDHKVSELCSMPDEKIHRLLDEELSATTVTDNTNEYFISQVIAAAMRYSEERFDKVFSNCILRYGIKDAYIKVLYPALVRIGLMWSKDELPPAQEHFITSLFRQKFLSAIDALPPPSSAKNSWLLFLPEDEFHETGLLFASYLIRQANKKVIYLGANVPYPSLADAINDTGPSSLLFFLVRRNNAENDRELISLLSKDFSAHKIYVACDSERLEDIKLGKNIIPLHTAKDLEMTLSK
jgi:MerR family transcriptional regulator, light-induced transcriptional regulator